MSTDDLRGALKRYSALIMALGGYGAHVRGQSVGRTEQIIEGTLGEAGSGGYQPTITTDTGVRYRVRLDTISEVRSMAKKRKPRVVHVVCKDAAGYRWLRQHSPEATGATVTAKGFAVVDEGKWAQALRAAGGQEL